MTEEITITLHPTVEIEHTWMTLKVADTPYILSTQLQNDPRPNGRVAVTNVYERLENGTAGCWVGWVRAEQDGYTKEFWFLNPRTHAYETCDEIDHNPLPTDGDLDDNELVWRSQLWVLRSLGRVHVTRTENLVAIIN